MGEGYLVNQDRHWGEQPWHGPTVARRGPNGLQGEGGDGASK